MDHNAIVADMTSGDTQRIRVAACDIIYAGQNRALLQPLIPYIERMRMATKGLQMGGMFAPNQRFPDYAIKTLEYHRDVADCTCGLYAGSYDDFDPDREIKAGHVTLVSKSDDNYFMLVKCKRCGTEYDIEVFNGHYLWYKWKKKS